MLSSILTLLAAAFLVTAVDRATEQGEAQISDPLVECTPYYYAPVANAMAVGQFPQVWTPATILPNDTSALAKFQSIQPQIPNISPNGYQPGSLMGNWGNYAYPSSDPNCWWSYSFCTTPKLPGLSPDFAAAPEPNALGYGFDDGPNCSHNAFYDFLAQNKQRATMFYIGSNVIDWPLEAQRGLADGHEICVHTWSHRYMTAFTNEEVFAELYYSMEAIKLVVGVTPTCWRPPYGDVDDRVRWIANALGLRTIIWEYDSEDWRAWAGGVTSADVDANYEALITSAQNGTFNTGGTILLAHELSNFTMSEAMRFYGQLKSAFAYLVPMGVAANHSNPYAETNYSLPTFEQWVNGTGSSGQSSTSASSPSKNSSTNANAAPGFSGTLNSLAALTPFMIWSLKLI